MNQKSEEGLFDVLEKELKKRKEPVDCVTLYNESAAIRDRASTPNRVSDYLGNMWRKGQLLRLPAPRGEGNKSRWLYAWKGKAPAPKPDLSQAIEYDPQVGKILDKPHLHIEEEDGVVVITMAELVITIKQRNRGD